MRTTSFFRLCLSVALMSGAMRGDDGPPRASGTSAELDELRRVISAQEKQIEDLRQAIRQQNAQLDRILAANNKPSEAAAGASVVAPNPPAAAASASDLAGAETRAYEIRGFRFTGDLRFRLDSQIRSGNEFAPPLQNIRGRYRFRVNIDKDLDRRFAVHAQLSTGPLNNANTNDQDFGGITAKAPFSLSEAYISFKPNSVVQLRAGRMEEVFADNMRFLWDDDVRFTGFQQIAKAPIPSGWMGLTSIEFRAGEYILSNPNVVILPASSPFVNAGYAVGQKVRDSNLFHPGAIVTGSLGSGIRYQLGGDVQLYRNPAQIQLASLANGYPALVNSAIGVALAGPLSGSGNGTTAPGGAIYTARNFQVARLSYRLSSDKLIVRGKEIPAFLDFQASRNLGTSKRRNAWMVTANAGSVNKFGDVRLLYSFAVKDANAMISQFTDDDMGTGTGVNIAVQGVRVDVGLTKFLQLQNLFFLQRERDRNHPEELFFVPIQAGANGTVRFLGQLAFTF